MWFYHLCGFLYSPPQSHYQLHHHKDLSHCPLFFVKIYLFQGQEMRATVYSNCRFTPQKAVNDCKPQRQGVVRCSFSGSHVDAGTQALDHPLLLSQAHYQGADWEVDQLGLKSRWQLYVIGHSVSPKLPFSTHGNRCPQLSAMNSFPSILLYYITISRMV